MQLDSLDTYCGGARHFTCGVQGDTEQTHEAAAQYDGKGKTKAASPRRNVVPHAHLSLEELEGRRHELKPQFHRAVFLQRLRVSSQVAAEKGAARGHAQR